jgi:hypothetical protein
MLLQELKEQVLKLSIADRLALASTILESLQNAEVENWQYLVARPHPWRQQLYVKGRKVLASTVWQDMIANEMALEQAAENWGLPVLAITEIVRYCEGHQALLKLEAEEERYRLESAGVQLEPTTTS